MEFTDAELAVQPIGYWSGAANAAVIRYINDRMGELGVTQRHWWTLYQVGVSGTGLTREGLVTLMRRIRPYVDASALEPAVDELLGRELLSLDGEGRLRLTDPGAELRDRVMKLLPGIRAQIHDGVSDEDYVRVVKVLRRMIGNVGGNADFV
ncbi:hypothetical protein GCM10010193_18960 [Kitasatospora atroaurantiaca]|uniref:DNA-binding MarR family transcriptional regulator n=1 Tax=Kitasatospora atroaurantiaca TaxID=285545 RepID=A0A561EPE5_9ACTN|nr:MarR family winged helix-turn-helix transcriptional regulator [Kitasatospora atroaurantiaca]TWE17488.1 hypothetical protein FB465_2515 [Kitasatospora atroaurantiaca]